MLPDWLVGAFGTAGTILLGFLTWAATRKTNLQSRVERLEKRVFDFEKRYGRASDYVEDLREHIILQKQPPPPPYPANYFD